MKSLSATSREIPPAFTRRSTASSARRGGTESAAGEAEIMLPPTVPRLRICGPPTWEAAVTSAPAKGIPQRSSSEKLVMLPICHPSASLRIPRSSVKCSRLT